MTPDDIQKKINNINSKYRLGILWQPREQQWYITIDDPTMEFMPYVRILGEHWGSLNEAMEQAFKEFEESPYK